MIKEPFEFAEENLDYLVHLLLQDKPLANLGFRSLDKMLGGLHSRLIVIAGEPGTGKTTFTLQLADCIAMQHRPTIVASLEIPARQLIAKSLARNSAGSLKVSDITGNNMTSEQLEHFKELVEWYRKEIAPYIGFITGPTTIAELGALVAKIKANTGQKPVVFLDYVQIVTPPEELPVMEERAAIKATAVGLRRIVNNHDAPVIAVSSINRTNYNKPTSGLDALGGSSAIEYGADAVIFLNVDGKNEERIDNLAKPIRPVTVTVLKNRYGCAGKVSMEFDTAYATFRERL